MPERSQINEYSDLVLLLYVGDLILVGDNDQEDGQCRKEISLRI